MWDNITPVKELLSLLPLWQRCNNAMIYEKNWKSDVVAKVGLCDDFLKEKSVIPMFQRCEKVFKAIEILILKRILSVILL